MDLIKAQFDRLSEQIRTLSATQKMLTAALVAIMAMTLVWWAHYAGEPDMSVLLDQTLSQDDIGQIVASLQAEQIPYRMNGDRVMVPTERKFEVLANLGYAHQLPHDFATGFDEIARQLSPWDPASKTDAMFNHAKELTLARVMSSLPGVNSATVMIDPTSERRFDNPVSPSATINIFTHDGKTHSQKLVTAVADMTCGCVAGLARGRISVIVDGVSYPVADKSDDSFADGSDSMIDEIRKNEEYYRQKIEDQFRDITGLMVSVTVDLDSSTVQTTSMNVDTKNTLHVEAGTHDHSEESTSANPGGGEPGTGANVGASIATASGGSGTSNSTISDNTATFTTIPSTRQEVKHQPAGRATVSAASVRVPRSHFVWSFKATNSHDPSDVELRQWINDELAAMHKSAVACCSGLKTDDALVVSVYSDAMPVAESNGAAAAAAAAMPHVPAMLGAYGKEIGVGALAAVSLFMMMMMVRRSSPVLVTPVAESKGEPAKPVRLTPGDQEVAGEAGDADQAIDAVELDEEAVKTQQMLGQVGQMVTENPDAAANLVKRWLNRS